MGRGRGSSNEVFDNVGCSRFAANAPVQRIHVHVIIVHQELALLRLLRRLALALLLLRFLADIARNGTHVLLFLHTVRIAGGGLLARCRVGRRGLHVMAPHSNHIALPSTVIQPAHTGNAELAITSTNETNGRLLCTRRHIFDSIENLRELDIEVEFLPMCYNGIGIHTVQKEGTPLQTWR